MNMHGWTKNLVVITSLLALAGCGEKKTPANEQSAEVKQADTQKAETPKTETPKVEEKSAAKSGAQKGLLLTYSVFETKDGKATAKTAPAKMELLFEKDGKWESESILDPDSNVFHKAMPFEVDGKRGIVSAGGSGAHLKFWTKEGNEWKASPIWSKDFGGKFSRMRDFEIADIDGKGKNALVIATHDQGIVAIARHEGGEWKIEEIDQEKDTFIHEIEIGDTDGDGVKEAFATPSEPNRFDAKVQKGVVVRYVPQKKEGRKVVADLGDRHAKEIFVGDVDGDGKDELYVAVEGRMDRASGKVSASVEIRRYESTTDPKKGAVIATIEGEHLTRFLTVGDVDGDGKKEMAVASFSKGLWLIRPGSDANGEWGIEKIDGESGGFEHASIFADLDGDGKDELYVASDTHGELRRYQWKRGRAKRDVLLKREIPRSHMTWNVVPVAPF